MAIREELVTSAVQFLQDPSVASSTVDQRISFLRSKNLTPEEVDIAMARSGGAPLPQGSMAPYQPGPPQYYQQQFPQHAWGAPPPPPRRDWRDWFIMATVVSGVGYGIYSLGKRYVMPLVAPPTPEKLEQDKKSIEEQFDRAFSLVEQLSKDTEALKSAEQQRTKRLDTAISDLETVMVDLKSANRRREEDAQRIREEVQALKDAIPKALGNQKEVADSRLKEINGELLSLKTLVSQRMTSTAPTAATIPARPSPVAATVENVPEEAAKTPSAPTTPAATETPKPKPAIFSRPSGSAGGKASIPAWQMALANKKESSSSSSETPANEEGSSSPAAAATTA